ncbi:MAG: putative transposase [Nitrospirae bacterium]|nr:MAG: putative transposase [Nitrospirota bacterium]
MHKAYRYRIYPTTEQKLFLDRHYGCCRFVYNHFLALRKEKWKNEQASLSGFDCKKMLPELKRQHPWLAEVNSQSLQAAVLTLESAYRRFFKGLGQYPQPHKKHSRQAFSVTQNFILTNGTLRIPKLKTPIRVKQHRPLGGHPKNLTIIRESSGKYYASVVCECVPAHLPISDSTVGVDLGLRDLAVLSTGEKLEHPKWLRKAEKRLSKAQRRLSRKQKGSANRQKVRIQVARLHERIKNQRQDFLHKLSHRLIIENQEVSIERLRVRNMVKNRHLAKSISDSGWSELARQFHYKAEWYGRTVKVIDTFAPSSKTCSMCGYVHKGLKLSQRVWQCPSCLVVHDRDHNAAVNIDIIGQGMPEVTPAERRAAAVSVFSIKQVRSKKHQVGAKKQEALASQ